MRHFHKILIAAAASAILLTGCGGESSAVIRTVIPSVQAMESSMKSLGYKTNVLGDLEKDGFTIFSASVGESPENFDGVMVMRTVKAEDIESKKSNTQSVESENTVIWVKTNDPDFGNVMITGTENAIRKAGITLGD